MADLSLRPGNFVQHPSHGSESGVVVRIEHSLVHDPGLPDSSYVYSAAIVLWLDGSTSSHSFADLKLSDKV